MKGRISSSFSVAYLAFDITKLNSFNVVLGSNSLVNKIFFNEAESNPHLGLTLENVNNLNDRQTLNSQSMSFFD